MKKLAPALALIAAAGLVYWFSSRPAPAPAGGDAPEAAAPLEAPSLAGPKVSLASYKGKVVLVDFWATWCDPCRAEIPELNALHAKLGPQGFTVLGVSMDEETAQVKPFADKLKIAYPVLLLGGERPPDGWRIPGLPTAYLIRRDGTIAARWFGQKNMRKTAAAIEAALAR